MTELNLFTFIMNLCTVVFCGGLIAIIPALTRKAFLFGVKVPESAQTHPEVKSLKKRYIIFCMSGVSLVLLLSIAQYILWPNLTILAICYFPLLIAFLQVLGLAVSRKKALQLKETYSWHVSAVTYAQSLSTHSRGDLRAVKWGYFIVSLFVIFLGMGVALVRYPALPDLIPSHFDMQMNPDAWMEKSLISVMNFHLINLALVVFMAVVAVMMVKAKLQVSPENPSLSFAQHRAYRKYMGHALGILTLGLVVVLTILGLMVIFWPRFSISFSMLLILILLPSLPIVVAPVRIGQGGCKLNPPVTGADAVAPGYKAAPANAVSGRDDDKYWALGMFYHNPEDPSILVEDRFGSSIGLNYSRVGVKIGVGCMIAAVIALYAWMTPLLLSLI